MGKVDCRLLVVDGDPRGQKAYTEMIAHRKLNYTFKMVDSCFEVKNELEKGGFDVVITDYYLKDGTALDILEAAGEIPAIVITAAGSEEIAVMAMKSGAFDYLVKDPDSNYIKKLPVIIENAVRWVHGQKKLRMLSHALMSIGESVYITDIEDRIIFVNRAFINTYGYEESEILGRKSALLWDGDRQEAQGDFKKGTIELNNWESYHIRKDGTTFPTLVTISYIYDEIGSKTAVVVVVRDVSEIRAVQQQLELYATTDALTGVLNRRAGLLLLEKQMQLCKRNDSFLSVCYIDVNGLKGINDKYGHQEGDQYIQTVIAIIKDCIREADTLCRIGGDEFLLILTDCSIEKAKEVWSRIEKNFHQYNKGRHKAYCLGISYGFAEYSHQSELQVDELVALADHDMYKYKKIIKCSSL